MEIGVGLPTNLRGTHKELVLAWAQRAEALGFASLCMGERLTYAGYDWLLALTAAASVTTRIRLLANVIILPIHPIGVVAKQSLSLDDFSGGRLSLGVGLGTPLDDYDVAPAERAGRGGGRNRGDRGSHGGRSGGGRDGGHGGGRGGGRGGRRRRR